MVVGVTARAVVVTRTRWVRHRPNGGERLSGSDVDGCAGGVAARGRGRRDGARGNASQECGPHSRGAVPGRSGAQPWAVAGAGAATVSAAGAGVSSTSTVASSPAAPAAAKEMVYAVAEGGPPSPST